MYTPYPKANKQIQTQNTSKDPNYCYSCFCLLEAEKFHTLLFHVSEYLIASSCIFVPDLCLLNKEDNTASNVAGPSPLFCCCTMHCIAPDHLRHSETWLRLTNKFCNPERILLLLLQGYCLSAPTEPQNKWQLHTTPHFRYSDTWHKHHCTPHPISDILYSHPYLVTSMSIA